MKRCKKCGEEKPRTAFRPHKQTRDRLNPWCAECNREASRRSRQKQSAEKRRHRARSLLDALRPSEAELSAWERAVDRWGLIEPSPDDVMTEHYGTEAWDRKRPGAATALAVMARSSRQEMEERKAQEGAA